MKTKTGIVVILGLLISANAFATLEHEHKIPSATTASLPSPKAGSAEFEKIKALAGIWKDMTTTGGKPGEPTVIAVQKV